MKTTATSLPEVVTRYLAAANRFDAARVAACFAPNAIVHDENRDYAGRDAIRAWAAETGRKYQPTFMPLRSFVSDNRVSLSVAVSGQFPGSPVTLDFELKLQDGKISTLTIE
jgi:ketosteroid isomerase-like protein